MRSQQTKDNPFTINPPSGIMAPYSRTAIAVRYKPEDLSSSRGFNSTQQPSDQSARNYDFMALVEVFG